MFRQDRPRTFTHNLRLATILSFVAGLVNISGLLSINILTTNVTGHFAFFSEHFVNRHYHLAFTFTTYILAFFCGALVCSFLVEMVWRTSPRKSHALPMALEIMILTGTAVATSKNLLPPQWSACALLFAMGLQNALVTKISQATVRTTHLTGLFTDLGIEIAQLFFYREKPSLRKLRASISLRLAIIAFFFLGGVIGGFLYGILQLKTLLIGAAALVLALIYQNVELTARLMRKKLNRIH